MLPAQIILNIFILHESDLHHFNLFFIVPLLRCNWYSLLKIKIMKKNMGTIDKVVRLLAAIVVIGLYVGNVISGTVASVLLIVAGIFIATSFLSFCPIYFPFGFSTRKK